LAEMIHEGSLRREGPFIAFHCGAIPEDCVEAGLFGYERGAEKGKPGMLERIDTGTIFLQEVGYLPLPVQGKLLRVLEDAQGKRVGGKSYRVDVRIIAGTTADLEEAVKYERFREDLFYRLNIVSVVMPPLREREGDVLLLAEHFMAETCQAFGL